MSLLTEIRKTNNAPLSNGRRGFLSNVGHRHSPRQVVIITPGMMMTGENGRVRGSCVQLFFAMMETQSLVAGITTSWSQSVGRWFKLT
jgi:hypothetical protein